MLGVFLVFFACLLWAFDTLIRYPLIGEGVKPSTIVFLEHLCLCLFFFPVIIKSFSRFWNAKFSYIFYFVLLGGLGSAVSTLCFTRAFSIINPSLVILLQKLQPIVAIILARFVLGERIRKNFIYWAVLCLMGGIIISHLQFFPYIFKIISVDVLWKKEDLFGVALALVAVVGWGSATVLGKKLYLLGFNDKEIMAGRFLMGFLFLLPMFFAGEVNIHLEKEQNFKIISKTYK